MVLIPSDDRSEYFWSLRVSLFPCSVVRFIEADKYCALTLAPKAPRKASCWTSSVFLSNDAAYFEVHCWPPSTKDVTKTWPGETI
jgi:hypothetical protein